MRGLCFVECGAGRPSWERLMGEPKLGRAWAGRRWLGADDVVVCCELHGGCSAGIRRGTRQAAGRYQGGYAAPPATA
jgi:hypothetical protein